MRGDDGDDGPPTPDVRRPEDDEIKRLQEAARDQLERERVERERQKGQSSDDE